LKGDDMPAAHDQARSLALLLTPVALALLTPGPLAAVRSLSEHSSDPTAPVLAAVATAAWGCSGWLALLVVLTGLGRLPGVVGSRSRSVAARLAPAAVRSLLRVAVGTAVTASVVSGSAAWADGAGSLDWPTTPVATQPRAATPAAALDRVATHPHPLAAAVPPSAVVVQPGDSLWAIAAHRLGRGATDRQVAQAWPQWWAANRVVVGEHPDLIRPGTRLTPPTHR
jgi:nucleoid-associated protein YgaU